MRGQVAVCRLDSNVVTQGVQSTVCLDGVLNQPLAHAVTGHITMLEVDHSLQRFALGLDRRSRRLVDIRTHDGGARFGECQ